MAPHTLANSITEMFSLLAALAVVGGVAALILIPSILIAYEVSKPRPRTGGL